MSVSRLVQGGFGCFLSTGLGFLLGIPSSGILWRWIWTTGTIDAKTYAGPLAWYVYGGGMTLGAITALFIYIAWRRLRVVDVAFQHIAALVAGVALAFVGLNPGLAGYFGILLAMGIVSMMAARSRRQGTARIQARRDIRGREDS